MRTLARISALLLLSLLPAACGGNGGAIPSGTQPINQPNAGALSQTTQRRSIADINGWQPLFTVLPPQRVNFSTLEAQAAASVTIPFFTGSIVSPLDHKSHSYRIVGTNPNSTKISTNVAYVPIIARIHFGDGTVLDPTLPGCSDSISVANRFFGGPNFVPASLVSNGVAVGNTQITDAFQRAEFWSMVKGTNYHTLLQAAVSRRIVDVNAPAGSRTVGGVCAGTKHRIGEIPIGGYDAIVQHLATLFATTAQVPVVLSYNVFETSNGACCILGYHSAFGRSAGTQVYAVGAYNDAGIFNVPIEDIHAWTHELGELFNDPFVSNVTPPWGHVGQVSGCSNVLEVGDPLTGKAFTLLVNGFRYHPQELAFFSWFFRTTSSGTAGLYSFEGTFRTVQGACV